MKYIIYCSSDGTFYSNRDSDEWSTDSVNAYCYESRSEAQSNVCGDDGKSRFITSADNDA